MSGEVETISIEVKRGTEAFATATGQALGYKVYANRVYLADLRDEGFTHEQIEIASHLGVGLIRIVGSRCYEELSSPYYKPSTRMNGLLLERLGLGHCQLCGSTLVEGALTQLRDSGAQNEAINREGPDLHRLGVLNSSLMTIDMNYDVVHLVVAQRDGSFGQ